jgi:hypothetical protein
MRWHTRLQEVSCTQETHCRGTYVALRLYTMAWAEARNVSLSPFVEKFV